MTPTDSNSLGNVINIKCDLESPSKCTISSMDLNAVNLICGQNGSGKTMLNKLIYFASLTTYMQIKRLLDLVKADETREKIQYVFDGVFSHPGELTGHLIATFTNGTFECYFVNGTVTSGSFKCEPNVTDASYPKYMSTDTRLFTAMESILQLAKALPEEQLLKSKRLYDVSHCMMLAAYATNISRLSDDVIKSLKEFEVDATAIEYDEEDCVFTIVNSLGQKRFASSLSNGHQSLINMIVSSSI